MGLIRKPGEEVPLLAFPAGMDNTSPEEALPLDEFGNATAARDAANIDFHANGKWRSRTGSVLRLALDDPRALFADIDFPLLVVQDGGAIKVVDPTMGADTVVTGLGEGAISCCQLNGEVLWTLEGQRTGRLGALLADLPLGLPAPAGVPAAAATALGGLGAGTYRVALSYLDAYDEEGGACASSSVAVADGGGIVVTLPTVLPDMVAMIRVWVAPEGGELEHALDVEAGETSIHIGDSERGDVCHTQGLHPLPAGQLIREINGVVLMAAGNRLCFGQPMRPRLYQPGRNVIPFQARIDMLQVVGQAESAGIYVASGKRTYYLDGAYPKAASLKFARVHGAVPGSGATFPGDVFGYDVAEVAYWMGTDGTPCVGLPGGKVVTPNKRARMTQFEQAASLLREVGGIRQVVTAGKGGAIGASAAGDVAEVRQYRNGIEIP